MNMTQKLLSPLKIGLLIVTIAYLLFTFHAMFTLAWIGEWEIIGGGSSLISFWIFATDISATFGLIFRFIASLIAICAMIAYFIKKGLSQRIAFKILKVILVFEAIYWLGLLLSGVWGILPVQFGGFGISGAGLQFNLSLLITTGLPCLVAAIAIPLALFKLTSKLGSEKPLKGVIKWGLIAGTIYIFVFWLNNTGMWLVTVMSKGLVYLTAYPENLLSFAFTTIGLLVLAVFALFFAKRSVGVETLQDLKLRPLGAIVLSLGMYFLWNYLTWIFFGRSELWSDWYAWFLGHNLDLWLLSIPLVGIPLMLEQKPF